MLACSPIEGAEEWAIHEFEGFGGIRLSEWESIERVHELSEFMQEHGKIGSLVLEHYCGDIDDAQRTIENYIGCYCRMGDYAEEITESCTEISEHLKFYIDYERMERDMEMNGDIFTIETSFDEIHIFLSN